MIVRQKKYCTSAAQFRHFFSFLMVLVLNLGCSGPAIWEQTNGPFGASLVYDISVNSNGAIFAGTNSGIFRTTDGGESWESLNDGFARVVPGIQNIVFNSKGHIFVAIAGEGGIYRSKDDGLTWTEANHGFWRPYPTVNSMTINSKDELFVAISMGFYRSLDNGESWVRIDDGIHDQMVNEIAVHPNGDLFVITRDHGVFQSRNNGDSWISLDFGFDVRFSLSIAINKKGYIFVGTADDGILLSTDTGKTWSKVFQDTQYGWYRKIVIDSDENIYALTKGILCSSDNGKTWEHLDNNFPTEIVTTLTKEQEHLLFAGTSGYGIFRSNNAGENWSPKNEGLTSVAITTLRRNQQDHLFAGTFMSGIFRSTDKGKNWKQINNGLGDLNIRSITFDSRGGIIAAAIGGIFYSDNNGENWSRLTDGPTPRVASEIIIDASGHMWAGGYMIPHEFSAGRSQYRGLFYSTDNGKTWMKIDYDFAGKKVRSLATNSNGDLFAGTYQGGLHRFMNDEKRWKRVGIGIESVWEIAIGPKNIVLQSLRRESYVP